MREHDGDFTFGCGMFNGQPADPCSCLMSEARASKSALEPNEWLWWRPFAPSTVNDAAANSEMELES